jgi:methyl-accepting chemotaxis protein
MALIAGDMTQMESTVGGITQNMTSVRDQLGAIALTIDQVNNEMQIMTHEMHRMGKPARSMNKMFPFP